MRSHEREKVLCSAKEETFDSVWNAAELDTPKKKRGGGVCCRKNPHDSGRRRLSFKNYRKWGLMEAYASVSPAPGNKRSTHMTRWLCCWETNAVLHPHCVAGGRCITERFLKVWTAMDNMDTAWTEWDSVLCCKLGELIHKDDLSFQDPTRSRTNKPWKIDLMWVCLLFDFPCLAPGHWTRRRWSRCRRWRLTWECRFGQKSSAEWGRSTLRSPRSNHRRSCDW